MLLPASLNESVRSNFATRCDPLRSECENIPDSARSSLAQTERSRTRSPRQCSYLLPLTKASDRTSLLGAIHSPQAATPAREASELLARCSATRTSPGTVDCAPDSAPVAPVPPPA